MIHLDYFQTIALLDRAVAEKGEDHTYQAPEDGHGCYYVHVVGENAERIVVGIGGLEPDREDLAELTLVPGCLVGYVLHLAGVPLEKMAFCGSDSKELLRQLREDEVLSTDADAKEILERAQGHQDNGIPWGMAVVRAKEYGLGYRTARMCYDIGVE